VIIYYYYIYEFYTVSSSYLLVFGDDLVTYYTGANDVAGGAGKA